MMTALLVVSLLLQLTAVLLALRLIRVTGGRSAWILIAAGIVLMAVRRAITLYRILSGDPTIKADPAVEWVALGISALMAAGIALIAPIFLSYRRSEAALAASEKERRGLEAQFLQAQKMEALGRLAGGVAHDFNNLLTVVLGYADNGLRSLPDSHPVRRDLAEIQTAGKRASDLTRQLLTFSKSQPMLNRTVDLNAAVSGIETLLRRVIGEDVRLQVSLKARPGWIACDPVHLEQILMNLAVNARDAMPKGGELSIETFRSPAPEGAPAERVGLIMRDTGIGMSPEIRSRIFEPFFTTKPNGEGSGLGLTTVYGLVTQRGGTVEVESAPGRGSSFKILFPPAAEPRAAADVPPAPAAEVERKTAVVLVVEDEAAIRELVNLTLTDAGYRVLKAADGEAALQVARAHPDTIDLLLTDAVMPRMGGVKLARLLSQERPGLRVLVVSGYAEESMDGQPGLEFLAKPFSPVELLRRVALLLQKPVTTPS